MRLACKACNAMKDKKIKRSKHQNFFYPQESKKEKRHRCAYVYTVEKDVE